MPTDDLLTLRAKLDAAPKSETARQAVNALRGYTYQLVASALAWTNIGNAGRLYLEVAEDYAVVAGNALTAVQIKDTRKSGTITLNSNSVQRAIAAFVDLVHKNADMKVSLRFLTTSEIGTEQALADRLGGIPGLEYWRRAARRSDLSPLRAVLESNRFPKCVQSFCRARNDQQLRRDLLRRIHWDCGSPNVKELRQQLEARLIVVGRNLFGIAAAEVPPLADQLIYTVLERIVNTDDRVLTRDQLYTTIEVSTQLSVPRTLMNQILRSHHLSPTANNPSSNPDLSSGEPSWLSDSNMLPARQGMISRTVVESAISRALRDTGVCLVVGATGVGKSVVSIAVAQSDPFVRADLGDIDVQETCHRLHMILARIDGTVSSLLILDDANRLHDKQVAASLSLAIEASRQSDQDVIITCSHRPSASALFGINIDSHSVVDCPYFSEQEASQLVHIAGGDPKKWGRLAFVVAAGGHPQLTHAFVIGIAERGWPDQEIDNVIRHGFTSPDIDAARDDARRAIANALPDGTRILLYRLSLVMGPFNRSLALAIAAVSPHVSQRAEHMDQLIGPWIERIGRDLFRVTPLAADFGTQMLTADEQAIIHNAIALELVKRRTVDPNDINALTLHALAGNSTSCLAAVVQLILSAESESLPQLADQLFVFRLFKTSAPIYDQDRLLSTLLRLVQFRLSTASQNQQDQIPHVCTALFREIDAIPDTTTRQAFEGIATLTVLCTLGSANYLHDWLYRLHRVRMIIEANEALQRMTETVVAKDTNEQVDFFSILFSIGLAHLESVHRLEDIVNDLNRADPQDRAAWLTPIAEDFVDHYTTINQPWTNEERRGTLDSRDAALRYSRMARTTREWGTSSFSMQCSVAQAVMLYEYQSDNHSALTVLEDARTTWGDHPILTRALANFFHYCGEHARAIEVYERIADDDGDANPIENAYRFRRSAISAARQEKWQQAKQWFLQALRAARLASSNDMTTMAIGLAADAAVAALHTKDSRQALTLLTEALEALPTIDSENTLRATFCRRSVHAAVVWTRATVMNQEITVGGQPIRMDPGLCSIPDPPAESEHLQPIDIDISWYFLATTEVAAGVDVGIFGSINDRLAKGQIPVMEADLIRVVMQQAVAKLDSEWFSEQFMKYVESMEYFSRLEASSKTSMNPAAPDRGQIPPITTSPVSPYAEEVAGEAILAFRIRAVTECRFDIMSELAEAIERRLTRSFPGRFMLDQCDDASMLPSVLDQVAVAAMNRVRDGHLNPPVVFVAGLALFSWIRASRFNDTLMPRLATWQRAVWSRIVATQSFRFLAPGLTVPQVNRAISIDQDDETVVASILLAVSVAIGTPLSRTDRDILQSIVERNQSLPDS